MTGDIARLLRAFCGAQSQGAWRDFLEQYSGILQQVIEFSCLPGDDRADCFVFVCEQLAARKFRRLCKFDVRGTASFPTWLRAVARNLCIDWQRKQHGRSQASSWTRHLSSVDQQLYEQVFMRGRTSEEAFHALAPDFPTLTLAEAEESVERIAGALSSRQHWLLSIREVRLESLDAPLEDEQPGRKRQIADPASDPESAAMAGEWQQALESALRRLSTEEQLLVHMRFEQGLTLAEIARLSGLKDDQAADRGLRQAVEVLRRHLVAFSPRRGRKARAASV